MLRKVSDFSMSRMSKPRRSGECSGHERPAGIDIKESAVEDRDDLAKILLDGLPDTERVHVAGVIRATDQAKLERLRAKAARVNANDASHELPGSRR